MRKYYTGTIKRLSIKELSVQDGMVCIAIQKTTLKKDELFSAWIFQILSNKCKKKMKEYYDAHKDELLLKHKIWRANNKEKVRAAVKKYHQLHPEVSKAAINKFRAKVNWAEYCGQKRKERVERLKAQGVINPWKVVAKKEEPKYKDNK